MAGGKKTGATIKTLSQEEQAVAAKNWLRPFITVLILIVVMSGSFYIHTQQMLPIKQVNVEGNLIHTHKADLITAVTPYVSGSFWSVNFEKIKAAGEALPWVRQVQVRRVWPDSLLLIVEEQSAIAKWNKTGVVNSYGQVFYPQQQSIPVGLVALKGPNKMNEMMARELATLQKQFKSLDLVISHMQMDERHALKLEFEEGLVLVLGRTHKQARLNRFIKVYHDSLLPHKEAIAEIDMRYTNGLAVKWKPEQQPELIGQANV